MTSSIKPAATVILMREVDEGGFEIFLVKRSSRSSFGNLYVFPGGKLDPEDSSEDLYKYCEDMNDAEASKKLGIKIKSDSNYSMLSHPKEIDLLKHMIRFPNIIENTLDSLEPEGIANYLQELATRFHKFFVFFICHFIFIYIEGMKIDWVSTIAR